MCRYLSPPLYCQRRRSHQVGSVCPWQLKKSGEEYISLSLIALQRLILEEIHGQTHCAILFSSIRNGKRGFLPGCCCIRNRKELAVGLLTPNGVIFKIFFLEIVRGLFCLFAILNPEEGRARYGRRVSKVSSFLSGGPVRYTAYALHTPLASKGRSRKCDTQLPACAKGACAFYSWIIKVGEEHVGWQENITPWSLCFKNSLKMRRRRYTWQRIIIWCTFWQMQRIQLKHPRCEFLLWDYNPSYSRKRGNKEKYISPAHKCHKVI